MTYAVEWAEKPVVWKYVLNGGADLFSVSFAGNSAGVFFRHWLGGPRGRVIKLSLIHI